MTADRDGDQDGPDDADLGFAPDERDRADQAGDLGFAPDERDAQEASGVTPPPRASIDPEIVAEVRATSNRWWAAIVVLVLIVVGGSLLTLYNGRSGSPSVGPGDPLPPFAAPLATEPKLAHDAVNYAAHGDEGEAGRVPACSVANRSVITSCALLDDGPLVLMMFANGIDECVKAVDDLNRLRPEYLGVQALAVAIGGDHGKTATTARNRRWTIPVAYDRDGGLASRLGAPACPFVLFVAADGTVRERLFGSVGADEIEQGMRALAEDEDRRDPTTTTPGTPSAPGR